MSDESTGSTESNAETFEPSMEDILTSIRRIIADDDSHKTEVPELLEGAEPQKVESTTASLVEEEVQNLAISDEDIDLMVDDLVIPDDSTFSSPDTSNVLETENLAAPTPSNFDESDFEADVQDKSETSLTGLNVMDDKATDTEMVSDDGLIDIDDLTLNAVEESETDNALVVDPAQDLLEEQNLLETDEPLETLDTFELTPDLVADDKATEASNLDNETLLSTSDQAVSEESDMDIVKALMADLTDDSFLDDLETNETSSLENETQSDEMSAEDLEQLEDLEDDDSIFELEEVVEDELALEEVLEEEELLEDVEETEEETEILDDILNLTLEDEESLQAEQNNELAQLEIETLEVDDPSLLTTVGKTAAGAGGLLAIAKMAEADAVEAEAQLTPEVESTNTQDSDQQASLEALLDDIKDDINEEEEAPVEPLSLDMLDAETDEESLGIEAQLDELEQLEELEIDLNESLETELEEITQQSIMEDPQLEALEEKETMPRAKKSDAILDEVEKTASADVFASLNKVVEEKAILAERGDRIGDLVMEALRPMLKEWLDANLKGIVERAVTKEVKRISSGK